MLVLNILPLLTLFKVGLCTIELITILPDSTSGIRECKSPGIVSCHKVAVNLAAVGDETLVFPEGKLMSKHQTLNNGFEYEAADGSEAVLTLLNGHIDGTLNYYEPNKLLTIESCGTGCHVLMQSDEVGNEGEVEGLTLPEFLDVPALSIPPSEVISKNIEEQDDSPTVVTVMWYYTKEFYDITSDPALYMESLINYANTAYQNSNISLRLETMCIERLSDDTLESNSATSTEVLTNFYNTKGSAAALRQTADIALLVTSSYIGGACGAAYLNAAVTYYYSGQSQKLAFGFVGKYCQTTVTPHEVGHMMGCCHNPENSCRNSYVPYAYGYWIPGTGKRTIMAYWGENNTARILYFASPTYEIDNVQAGTSDIDCRRSHLEYMNAISQIGDESNAPCTTGPTTTTTTVATMSTTTTTMSPTPPPPTTTTTINPLTTAAPPTCEDTACAKCKWKKKCTKNRFCKEKCQLHCFTTFNVGNC